MPFPAKTDAESILNAALAMIESEGPTALSMRELGKILGVRASSLYHYFPDRHSIESALCDRAFSALLQELHKASENKIGIEIWRGTSVAYINFARSNPALYHLATLAKSNPIASLAAISESPQAAITLSAFLHGYASLELAGHLRPADFEQSLEQLLQVFFPKKHIL